jgi:hypothetical protein
MVRLIDEITTTWAALSGSSGNDGWQTIGVPPIGSCSLLAARSIPGNEEALLVSFSSARVPAAEKLPEGRGFSVFRVDPDRVGGGRVWLALSRQPSGRLDLFVSMVADVIQAMEAESNSGEERMLQVFLGRVRAWQEFMRKGAEALEAEAEVGLVGELVFLVSLMETGVSPHAALESWVGPLPGVQDFFLGTGAVEVKSTLAPVGFVAKIGSLEQLDDSLRQPLYVAGVRLNQTMSGITLPNYVSEVRMLLGTDVSAQSLFGERLLAAGYLDGHAGRYVRRFSPVETKIVEVGAGFPRIVPGTVPVGIRRAAYEIDLDSVASADLPVIEVLKKLGVT